MTHTLTFTPKQVAAMLGCGTQSIRKLIVSGKLYAIDISSGDRYPRWLVPQSSIDALLTGQVEMKPTKEPAKRKRIDAGLPKIF